MKGETVAMGQVLLGLIGLSLVWEAIWWFLGVKPRFPWQLKASLGAGASDLFLLDVRTPLEYNWFHLPGAQNLPHVLADSGKMPPVSSSQDIVVICMTGHRSPLVAYALKKKGYARVYNLTWGMAGWKLYEWVSGVRGKQGPPNIR